MDSNAFYLFFFRKSNRDLFGPTEIFQNKKLISKIGKKNVNSLEHLNVARRVEPI